MEFSSRINLIGGDGSRAWEIHGAAIKRSREGRPVILLTIGDHDFDAPGGVVRETARSLEAGDHHYTPAAGTERLREAVAGWQGRLSGRDVRASEVIVLPGAQCALYTAAQCLFDPGDTVLVPDPMYATYEATLQSSGAKVRPLRLRPESRFHIDMSDIEAALDPTVKGIVLNSPHNPTGAALDRSELETLARICIENDLWLISDEVYATLVYEGAHVSPATLTGMAERTVTLGSLSKSHAMTGWRIGWAVAHPDLIGHMTNLAGCMYFGLPPFAQAGAVAAIDGCMDEVEAIRTLYRKRRDHVATALQGVEGLDFHVPEGGMFFMVDVRRTGLSAQDFAWRLLEEADVAVMPGDGFGPGGAGHIRLGLTVEEDILAEACERIRGFCALLSRSKREAC